MLERSISVIGLGYVGLPVAVAFSRYYKVIAFDINQQRIAALQQGRDITREVTQAALQQADMQLTACEDDLAQADFYIVTVPTPIDEANKPDLTTLLSASKTLGNALKSGDIVVYESTVYPGATEEECVPVLEATSGLICGKDFFVGYSPERINPGDRTHTFAKTCKIVSGMNEDTLAIIQQVYQSVIEADVVPVSSIKTAEAAKVIENSQRDLNIAFVNELAKIFHLMDIDTQEVLQAAGSKWNFHRYNPGLVGGHCIGVDPYYLTYKAEQLGYRPEVLLAGRRINDGMAHYIVEQTIKQMILAGKTILGAKVLVCGITFKEDCPDLRNSKVIDIIHGLQSYGCDVMVHDPIADREDALAMWQIHLIEDDELAQIQVDAAVLSVSHAVYRQQFKPAIADVLIDVKSVLDKEVSSWRL